VCTEGQVQPAIEHLRDFAARYTVAWCSHDPAAVARFFSETGSLRVNENQPARGRDAITEAARGFFTAFPDLRVQMDELRIENGRIFYCWTLTGTNTGPGGKGQRVRFSGAEEWNLGADNLIAASQGRFDNAEYQRQLEHGHCES
jgi:predicted ester cyclase